MAAKRTPVGGHSHPSLYYIPGTAYARTSQ